MVFSEVLWKLAKDWVFDSLLSDGVTSVLIWEEMGLYDQLIPSNALFLVSTLQCPASQKLI